jgi:hypothetical protein
MIGSNVFGQAQQYQAQAGDIYGGLGSFSPTNMQAAQAGPAQSMQAVQYGPANLMAATQLGQAERMQGVGAVQSAQAPGQIAVNQLASTNLDPYMSPYTQNVIEQGQADIERQRQLASNQLGAQAQSAGAFGGSRQAVQEGVLAGEALRQAGQLSAQQRQQAFTQALQSGQFDIGNVQQARTLASGQEFQASQAAQQAREAAAAREQAARSGNMQAANQFAVQQAQFEQQANQLNQAAQNQFAIQQAQAEQQARQLNQAATNQFTLSQAGRNQAANQANYQGQFQAAGVQSGAAGGMRGLGSTMFGQGITGLQQQQAAAARAQAAQQAMLDAGRQQTLANLGYPAQALQAGAGTLTMLPRATVTEGGTPGVFGTLATFSGLPGIG